MRGGEAGDNGLGKMLLLVLFSSAVLSDLSMPGFRFIFLLLLPLLTEGVGDADEDLTALGGFEILLLLLECRPLAVVEEEQIVDAALQFGCGGRQATLLGNWGL